MALPDTTYDVDPPRPGANPTLDLPTAGLTSTVTNQPAYILLTDRLVGWLRFHFSLSTRIDSLNLKDRVWTSSESTPIVITSLATWKPDTTNLRPALLVDRLRQEPTAQRGIADALHGHKWGRFGGFGVGQHVVHCVGGREGEAEYLAWEVYRELRRFGPEVFPKLCLKRFLPTIIDKRIQLDEHKSTYAVPVIIDYGYEEAWRLTPLDETEIQEIQTILNPPTP